MKYYFLALMIIMVSMVFLACNKNEPSMTLEETFVEENVSVVEEENEEYISPVDFNELWKVNDEIVAYLDIAEIPIRYPILMSKESNDFYLNHNLAKEYSLSGSIYIEDYNKIDFSDRVSVIYGHNMKNKEYFGRLQESFSSKELLEKNKNISIYLPNETISYSVRLAVPYSDLHILYYFDFSDEARLIEFLDFVYNVRDINAVFSDEKINVENDKRLLILSTCLKGNGNKRFIVVAEEN